MHRGERCIFFYFKLSGVEGSLGSASFLSSILVLSAISFALRSASEVVPVDLLLSVLVLLSSLDAFSEQAAIEPASNAMTNSFFINKGLSD